MFKILFISSIIIASSVAQARTTVKCYKESAPNYWIMMKMDDKGLISQWNQDQFVISDNDKKSDFSYLSVKLEESSFEDVKSFKAPNGYSIVRFVTTADAINVGVSKDKKTGFYAYEDHGSGNGSEKYDLKCVELLRK